MRMMLVGAGAVGECILKILQKRDLKSNWLEFVLVADYDLQRAQEVAAGLHDTNRFVPEQVNAKYKEDMVELMRQYRIDFVMDAATPFVSNFIFDAAFEGGAKYASMGTWSVPLDSPKFGLGIENSYQEPMTKYNFDRHQQWKDAGNMACICLGIDPGVVNVFAKYAAEYLLDELHEVHIKDGGNLAVPSAGSDDIQFGFNVWTVLDEVMNPNVEWDAERGGFIVEDAFAGEEAFEMPEDIGENILVKVEHEETVTLPRYLSSYGLKKATFKIALDDNLMNALKVLNALGLRSIRPVTVGGVSVVPRDVVAATAPQPKDIGDEMVGSMCVGAHCIGIRNNAPKEIFIYQIFNNQQSMKDWGMQAVVAQTGFGAALGIELIGKGIWNDTGVFSPEYFPSHPFIQLMEESGFTYGIMEIKK